MPLKPVTSKVENELRRLNAWLKKVGTAMTEEEAEAALGLNRRRIGVLRSNRVLESGIFFRMVVISERSVNALKQQREKRGKWTTAPFGEDAWESFLAALKRTQNVREACKEVKVSRAGAYLRKKTNEDFSRRWDAMMS